MLLSDEPFMVGWVRKNEAEVVVGVSGSGGRTSERASARTRDLFAVGTTKPTSITISGQTVRLADPHLGDHSRKLSIFVLNALAASDHQSFAVCCVCRIGSLCQGPCTPTPDIKTRIGS